MHSFLPSLPGAIGLCLKVATRTSLGCAIGIDERSEGMAWVIWLAIGAVLSLIDKRLLLLGAVVFGVGLGLGWW